MAAKIDHILAESGISAVSLEGINGGSDKSGSAASKRFSFDDFERPWKCVLELLSWEEDVHNRSLRIGLGYGRLELRIGGAGGMELIENLNSLEFVSSGD